ncbi:MAG: hypothetical protein GW949_09970 [Spirochaetales bacterium]|nr:hypothetical protein [Spirochaetales bacterium]
MENYLTHTITKVTGQYGLEAMKALTEYVVQPMVLVDKHATLTYYNSAALEEFRRLWNVTISLGSNFLEYLPTDVHKEFSNALLVVTSGSVDYHLLRPDYGFHFIPVQESLDRNPWGIWIVVTKEKLEKAQP